MRKKNIKRGAHAATYLAVWWTLFSAFGLFDWFDAHRYVGGPDAFVPLTIWGIHAFLIGVAVYAWIKERPTETSWIGEDDEILDVKPEDIDVSAERAKLKKLISSEVVTTIGIIGLVGVEIHFSNSPQNTAEIRGIVIFFVGVMAFSIICQVLKYAILRYRARSAAE